MSKVNKMYFHWMLQIGLPLLLTSLSCCHNGKIISVQLTYSGWWLCFQKWLHIWYLPSVHKFHQVLWVLKNAKSWLETAMVVRNWRSLTLVEVVWNSKSVMVTAKMEKPVWLVFSTEEKAENPPTGEAKVTKHRLKRKSREVCVYLWHQSKHSARELAAKSSQA